MSDLSRRGLFERLAGALLMPWVAVSPARPRVGFLNQGVLLRKITGLSDLKKIRYPSTMNAWAQSMGYGGVMNGGVSPNNAIPSWNPVFDIPRPSVGIASIETMGELRPIYPVLAEGVPAELIHFGNSVGTLAWTDQFPAFVEATHDDVEPMCG